MNASNTQIGGDHYTAMGDYQPWDVLQHWLTPEEYRGYQKGVIIAYLARERAKGGDQDIRKAAHHLQKLCEVISDKNGFFESIKQTPDKIKMQSEIEWIDWNGGDRPVQYDTKVFTWSRSGDHHIDTDIPISAVNVNWKHFGLESDVIKYAVVK